jgi:hypothetical protein
VGPSVSELQNTQDHAPTPQPFNLSLWGYFMTCSHCTCPRSLHDSTALPTSSSHARAPASFHISSLRATSRLLPPRTNLYVHLSFDLDALEPLYIKLRKTSEVLCLSSLFSPPTISPVFVTSLSHITVLTTSEHNASDPTTSLSRLCLPRYSSDAPAWPFCRQPK